MTTKQTWLDQTFYRHFFDPDESVRARAGADLDNEFQEAMDGGAGRYEVMRQMVCGITNAQRRFDDEASEPIRTTRNGESYRKERAAASEGYPASPGEATNTTSKDRQQSRDPLRSFVSYLILPIIILMAIVAIIQFFR